MLKNLKKIKKIGKKKKIIHKILKNIINIVKNIKKYFCERLSISVRYLGKKMIGRNIQF